MRVFQNAFMKIMGVVFALSVFVGTDGKIFTSTVAMAESSQISANFAALSSIKGITIEDVFNAAQKNSITFMTCYGDGKKPESVCWENGVEGKSMTATVMGVVNLNKNGTGETVSSGSGGSFPTKLSWRVKNKAIIMQEHGSKSSGSYTLYKGIYLVRNDSKEVLLLKDIKYETLARLLKLKVK